MCVRVCVHTHLFTYMAIDNARYGHVGQREEGDIGNCPCCLMSNSKWRTQYIRTTHTHVCVWDAGINFNNKSQRLSLNRSLFQIEEGLFHPFVESST